MLAEYLRKGDWVDAKDKEGVFRLARILYIEDKELSLRFEDLEDYRRDTVTSSLPRKSISTPRDWPH